MQETTCICRYGLNKLELYFDFYMYAQTHPNCFRRYNTVQLSNPICDYVENYKEPREELYESCERLITRIVETHRMYFLLSRSKCCSSRMVHTLLYVAARIAFRSKLPNSKVVVRLLSEIYRCDRSLKKIIMGAYFEPQDCMGICAIHPLYSSRDEGLQAMRYFFHHTNMAKKMFYNNGVLTRMADLSLLMPYHQHPAIYSIAVKSYSTFKLLLQFGTNLDDTMDEDLPNNLQSLKADVRTRTPEEPRSSVNVHHSSEERHEKRPRPKFRAPLCLTAIQDVINDNLEKERFENLLVRYNPSLHGQDMPCLMQMCRVVIRRSLHGNFQLPCGIGQLPIPLLLQRYINLDYD